MEVPFVHLGARSDYSLGESLARVEHLCRAAAADGQDAIGLADTMSLAGAPAFAASARLLGLKPLFGLEAVVAPFNQANFGGRFFRTRLLATDNAGWRRLVKLVNIGNERAKDKVPAHLTWEELFAETSGLYYLLGGMRGEMSAASLDKRIDHIEDIMTWVTSRVSRDRLFVALPSPATDEGCRTCQLLWAVAEHFSLAPVAVPEVNVAQPEDDIAWRAQQGTPFAKTLGDLARPREERTHLLTAGEAARAYEGFPSAIDNAAALADHCTAELPRASRRFPIPEFERGVDADSFVWNEAFAQATRRYSDQQPKWRERLNREFRELVDARLPDALVCLAQLDIEFDDRGILRGPGAGFLTNSLVASLLGLTRIDPLPFDLPFTIPEGLEQQVPLLEICVPSNQRDAAGEAVMELFRQHTCRVGRWQRTTAHTAVERLVERLQLKNVLPARLMRTTAWENACEQCALAPAGQDPDLSLALDDPRALAWLTRRLEGRVRASRPSTAEYAFCVEMSDGSFPCHRTAEGAMHTQWDAHALESLGYGRISFSQDPMLDLLDEATRWVREQGNRRFDPTRTPPDDEATFAFLREGSTQGIPLFESPSVQKRLRESQPADLDALNKLLVGDGAEPPPFEQVQLAYSLAAVKAAETPAFLAAALSQYAHDLGRVNALLHEAHARRIAIRPLDVNCSTGRWAPEGRALRPGFLVVHGMTSAAVAELENVRREMTYSDLADLLRRTDPRVLKTQQIDALIRAGALDSFHQSRRDLLQNLAQLEEIVRPRRTRASDADPLQFFGNNGEWWLKHHVLGVAMRTAHSDDALDWIVEQERETTGILLAVEPTYFETDFLRDAKIVQVAAITPKMRDKDVSLIGPVSAVEEIKRGEGARKCLVDLGGVLVEAGASLLGFFQKRRLEGRLAIVAGCLKREGNSWVMNADLVESPEDAALRSLRAEGVEIQVARLDDKKLKDILALVKEYPGQTPVRMTAVPIEGGRLYSKIAQRSVTLCPGLELGLMRILPAGTWRTFVTGFSDPSIPMLREETAGIAEAS